MLNKDKIIKFEYGVVFLLVRKINAEITRRLLQFSALATIYFVKEQ